MHFSLVAFLLYPFSIGRFSQITQPTVPQAVLSQQFSSCYFLHLEYFLCL